MKTITHAHQMQQMTGTQADEHIASMARFLQVLHDGTPFEIRALEVGHRGTVSGVFADPLRAAHAVWNALEYSSALGVYVTLNALAPTAVAQRPGVLTNRAQRTVRDRDIQRRRWILIDLDPRRPSGLSASDDEVSAAFARASDVRLWLAQRQWPDPLVVASGNGVHLLYPVDLPNDDVSRRLIKRFLMSLAREFNDDVVEVDLKNHNASRLTKLVGTMARKGKATEPRPHRRAALLYAPTEPVVEVALDLLKEVAICSPVTSVVSPSMSLASASAAARDLADVLSLLDANGVRYREKAEAASLETSDERRFELERCPWASHERPWKAWLIQRSDGRLLAGCLAAKCEGRTLADLLLAFESGPTESGSTPRQNEAQAQALHMVAQHVGPGDQQLPAEGDEAIAGVIVSAPERFPVEVLPRPLQRYIEEAAAATSCAVEYVAVPALVAAASAIGSTHELEIKLGWYERPALWAAVVGGTGTAKSPAQRIALKPLDEEQRRLDLQYRSEVAEYEQCLGDASGGGATLRKPVRRQVRTTDATVEALADVLEANPRGVLMVRDELSALTNGLNQYKNGKGADREFYLSSWAGAPALINRRTRSVSLTDSCLSIVGALPPDILVTLSGEKGREDGFIHRFLFAWPDPVQHRWSDAIIDPRVEEDYISLFRNLFQLRPQPSERSDEPVRPHRLQLDDAARARFVDYYNQTHERAEDVATSAAMRGPLAKMPTQVARLALTLHVCRRMTGETQSERVDGESMRAAICLGDYFVSIANHVYAHLTTRPEDARVVKFLDWMREHQCQVVTRRELLRARVVGLADVEQVDGFLDDLVKRRLGTVACERIRGGLRVTFTLAPTLLDIESLDTSTEPLSN